MEALFFTTVRGRPGLELRLRRQPGRGVRHGPRSCFGSRWASGDALPLGAAAHLALTPFAQAKLDRPPERAPSDPQSFAGLVHLPAPPNAGVYKVTISGEGWLDLIQADGFAKPIAFSGAVGCDGVRKSVKFRLEGAATLQVTGAKTPDMSVIVTPE